MRTVFFGSPGYALPTLQALIDTPGIEVALVVTQPDRPRGRSGAASQTLVRTLATQAGIEVLAVERVTRDVTARVEALGAEVGVLAASGHILPRHLLEAFPHGVLNVHASLLPRHRGASPVAAAILAGDAESGATIMQVVPALDAGPIVGTITTPIGPLDTAGTLTDRIALLGAERMLELLPRWVTGEIEAIPQDETLATYAPKLDKQDGVLEWSLPAEAIWRRVRAFHPWPLAATRYRDEQLTVHEAWPLASTPGGAPGTVIAGNGQALSPLLPDRIASAVVVCGEGSLALLRVQRAGRKALDIRAFLRGDGAFIGARLG